MRFLREVNSPLHPPLCQTISLSSLNGVLSVRGLTPEVVTGIPSCNLSFPTIKIE